MNYSQSFEEFSRSLNGTDLALYAGIGIVLWVLFKDKLSPVQEFILNTKNKFGLSSPKVLTSITTNVSKETKDDVFFELVASWKQTRDLAVKSGCAQAVEVADQMFPFLSPKICGETGGSNEV